MDEACNGTEDRSKKGKQDCPTCCVERDQFGVIMDHEGMIAATDLIHLIKCWTFLKLHQLTSPANATFARYSRADYRMRGSAARLKSMRYAGPKLEILNLHQCLAAVPSCASLRSAGHICYLRRPRPRSL